VIAAEDLPRVAAGQCKLIVKDIRDLYRTKWTKLAVSSGHLVLGQFRSPSPFAVTASHRLLMNAR
jgi:hypothetical protein